MECGFIQALSAKILEVLPLRGRETHRQTLKEGLSENNHNPLPFGTYFLETPNLVSEGCILRLEGQLLAVRLGSSIL